jgi:hypothetical protein
LELVCSRSRIASRRREHPVNATPRRIIAVSLRQADQARTDFTAIESELEIVQKQLTRLPTRRELAGTALGIMLATMMLTTLSLLFFLR